MADGQAGEEGGRLGRGDHGAAQAVVQLLQPARWAVARRDEALQGRQAGPGTLARQGVFSLYMNYYKTLALKSGCSFQI